MKRKYPIRFSAFVALILAALLLSFTLISCTDVFNFAFNISSNSAKSKQRNENTFILVEWNVQNLFNAEDDGSEYSEYASSSGWNEKSYKARLDRIKTVFSYFEADAVVLVEVENADVVADIIDAVQDYPYYSVCKTEGSAIAIAVISRYPITQSRIHTVENARSILEAELETSKDKIRIFAFHAKSKKGGEEETSSERARLAQTLLSLVSERRSDAESLILLAGDFNTTVDDAAVFQDLRYSETHYNNAILVSPVPRENAFYDFMLDPNLTLSAEGTYYYNSGWETIDYILSSYSSLWQPEEGDVVFKGILKSTVGTPNVYVRSLQTGVSDHLPIYLRLKRD